MSGESDQATQEKINLLNSTPEVQETENSSPGDQQDIDVKDENLMPVQQQEVHRWTTFFILNHHIEIRVQ